MNTLLIRADASPRIGTGHIMRCLALAQIWQEQGGKALFLSYCNSDILRRRIESEKIGFIPLEKFHPDRLDIKLTLQMLSELEDHNSEMSSWVVADGYNFDALYQKCIKEAGASLLCIDDYGHADHYYADIILNQNIFADCSLYPRREKYTRLLLGTRYALLRREFRDQRDRMREIPQIARKVLVTMGGGDSDNVTLKAIRALKKIDAIGIEAMIILGPANPNRQAIEEEIQSCPSSFRLLPVVENISALMAWADVAVAASGSTSWELAFMGLPSVVLILSENQIAVAEHLASEGLAINLGWHRDVSARMITDKLKALMADEDARNIMCKTGQSLVDGEGIMRVIMSMTMDSLSLRPIQEQDCEQIWKWSNSPEARAASFTSQYIPWRDHVQWFKSKLHDSFCLFFMAVNGWGTPIGQVRIDQKIQEAVLSVYVEGKYRGIGCGSKIIELASNKFFQVSDMRSIYAYVKLENEESRRAFMRAGFKFQGLTTISGCSAIHLALEKNDSE